MSQLASIEYEPHAVEAPAAGGIPWYEPPQRSIWQPILLVLPLLCALGGYVMATALLVDVAFVLLTILCCLFIIAELMKFSQRFGIAGLILYGGILIWFCDDYMSHWFLTWYPHWASPKISQVTVAKSATCHMLYILCLSIGIRFRWGKWLPKLITCLPEPRDPKDYFWVVVAAQIIGLLPFVVFTSEPFYTAIFHQITAGRGGVGAAWTVGRTGNLNTSWGGYVAELLQIGSGSAVLASFCVVFIRQGFIRTTICVLLWILWMFMNFGTGTRGEVVFLLVPLVCFLFIRFHAEAQSLLKRYSIRAYVIAAIVILAAVAMVQTQIRFRGSGFSDVNFSEVSLTDLQGNTMFSEGLLGFTYIPEAHNYFYDDVPGETLILPIPNLLFWMAVAPIPRALVTAKPVDPSWSWYNAVATGSSYSSRGATEGTTVSQGIVGYWFFRFGVAGVIEGGLFMGWLLGCFERALYNNRGRCIAVLASLGLATWFFRAFRDISLADLVECVVGLIGIIICIICIRPFTSGTAPINEYSYQD